MLDDPLLSRLALAENLIDRMLAEDVPTRLVRSILGALKVRACMCAIQCLCCQTGWQLFVLAGSSLLRHMNVCCVVLVAQLMSDCSPEPSLTAAWLCPGLQSCGPELVPWYSADDSLDTAALGAYTANMKDLAVKGALQRLQRLLDLKLLARASGQAVAQGETLPDEVVRKLQHKVCCSWHHPLL